MPKKKIIDKVLDLKTFLANNAGEADKNKTRAIAAIIGGIESDDWKTYMQQFVDNGDSDQLMRLLATDGTDADTTLRECRAYMLSNAICGETTKGRFDDNVKSIDRGLPGIADCEPTPTPPPPAPSDTP